MPEELDDPANAVPAATAAALDATAPSATRRADERHYVSAPAFLRALSSDARAAFARADDFRSRFDRGGVDVEHLIVGLHADPGGPARRAFDAAGVDENELARRLHTAGLDAPRLISVPNDDPARERFTGTTLEPVPPLTQAALDVVLDAERRASTGAMTAGVTDVEHLLRAVAASTHPAARLFADVWTRLDGPLVVRTLAPPELDALRRSLSVSSRKALGVADALRRARRADAVHMEHLLVGLYVQQGGHQWELFDAARVDAPALAARLAPFELHVALRPGGDGDAPPGAPIEEMPPLSDHARLALCAAATLADWRPDVDTPGLVQARLLLAGWLAVRECHVVAAFDAERPALAAGIRQKIDADRAAGGPAAQLADPQLRRLGQLLGDPPHVTWPRAQSARDSVPAAPSVGTGARAANDQPSGEDRLNFTHYVEAFANLIDSPHTTPPLTIGIYGAWGSGKSFLLGKLIEELRKRGAVLRPPAHGFGGYFGRSRRDPPTAPSSAYVYCVAFNAWEYNAAEHIWPRLVRRVIDSVTRDAQWRPLRWSQQVARRFRRNFTRKLRADWKSLAGWLVVGAGLWWGFAHLRPEYARAFADRVFGVDTSDDKFSVPAIVGAVTAAVKLVIDTLLAPLGGWVTAMLDEGPGYGAESDFVRAIRADLDLVDDQLVAEGSRVLILIDDLDRCEPDKAVEVLQAINLLLDRRSFIVCLGIDARVVTAAVEKHYENLLGPAGVTGYEYLDKIIQIPFRIPDPNDTELMRFVSMQLNDPTPDAPATPPATPRESTADTPQHDSTPTLPIDVAGPGAPPRVAPPTPTTPAPTAPIAPTSDARPGFRYAELLAFEQVAPLLRPNPRHVKRLVNVYALVRSLAELGGSDPILADPAATVRWLTLCAQWPYATRRMLDYLDARGAPDLTIDAADATQPPLRWLLDAVAPSLDAAKQARYDHDARVLERLVASSEGLSWDELRALRAYTVNFNPALDAELRMDDAEGSDGTKRRRAVRHRARPSAATTDRRVS